MCNNIEFLIKEIFKVRNIPQILFHSGINDISTLELKKTIGDYLYTHENIKEVDFIIESPGGSADSAYKIISFLRKSFETVNIIIPFWAKSAATILSLGGSKIIFSANGELGPIDVQLRKEKEDSYETELESALIDEAALITIEERAKSLFQSLFLLAHDNKYIPIQKNILSNQILDFVAKFYEPLLRQINPYKIGEKKRNLEIGERYAVRILSQYHNEIPQELRRFFIDFLVHGCPHHGYVVDYLLMKEVLPEFVITGEQISIEYNNLLTQLSFEFMSEEDYGNNIIIIDDFNTTNAQINPNRTEETNYESTPQ